MKKILLCGCNGHMGRVITDCVAGRSDCEIIAGVDINTAMLDEYPVFAKPSDFDGKVDAIIDFSHPACLDGLLAYATETKTPAVIATTGLSDPQIEQIHKAAKTVPVFFSANMSLGVNLIAELAKKAAAVLGNDFDVEIVEKHHNQKIDAPSGTALLLADAVSDALPHDSHYVYDRHSARKKRDKNEIGIHSVRGGTIVGEHEIIFAGRDEIVTLSHCAMSKEIFAVGAVNAALFIAGKEAGLYQMSDLV
jgi:4-hydroxy-tetrahydrodipicolinate reductase